MRRVILCWLTAGCGGFQRAPRRNPIKTRRSVEADPQDSSRAQREELQYGQRSEPDDSFYDELWNRVSALKNREIAADRKTVRNWRAGNSDHLAAVELEDTRVCQTRLNGRTVAFGTAAGVVVLVDLEEGTVLDGFDAHNDEITALDWAGQDKLVSGGADGAVVVYSPARHGESSLFELVEAEEYDDEDDDEDDDEEIEALYGALDELALSAGLADADAALARARLMEGLFPQPDVDERLIIEPHEVEMNPEDDGAGEGEPDVVLRGHTARVTGVKSLDEDANRVVSASLDKRVLLWDIERGSCAQVAEARSAVCCLAVADGLAVVGLLDGAVAGYDLRTGAEAFVLDDAHEGAVRSLHFSSESTDGDDAGARGRLLCTGGADGVVKCYTMQEEGGDHLVPRSPLSGAQAEEADVASLFRERRYGAHALAGHAGAVVAVQADDTKLVSASIDGSVRCWDLRTGETLFALEGHSRTINSLHFEGPLLVSDGTDGAVIVHDFSGQEYEDDVEWE